MCVKILTNIAPYTLNVSYYYRFVYVLFVIFSI